MSSSELHLACDREDLKLVKEILQKGGGHNLPNFEGDTPLHIACQRGNLAIVELLPSEYEIFEIPSIVPRIEVHSGIPRWSKVVRIYPEIKFERWSRGPRFLSHSEGVSRWSRGKLGSNSAGCLLNSD